MRQREGEFQGQVIKLARLFGWRVAHFRPAKTSKGWRTPVSADGKGFPDLIVAKAPKLIVAELKTDRGKTSDDQDAWLEAFGRTTKLRLVCVWRPRDWSDIESAICFGNWGGVMETQETLC